jgi:transposase
MDEGRFGLKSTYTRTWTRRGVTPSVCVLQGYKNFYAYSCASPESGDHFTLFLPEINSDMMSLFLKEFSKEHLAEHVLIILDQAGWHISKNLIIPENIELFCLPPYSPELNPVERLWRHLKAAATHNILHRTLDELMSSLQEAIQNLSTEKIRSLCHCGYLCHIK